MIVAQNDRQNLEESPWLPRPARECGGHDELSEIAAILAGALLRLRAKQLSTPKKREISRDNSLGCPAETRPPAVNF
jgi:hypothetical protein